MQRFELFFSQTWYLRMSAWERELVRTSVELLAREERLHSFFSDYAFVVFPMAKAYEGFLKKYFYDLGLVPLSEYSDKRFRIGHALNPDVRPDRRGQGWVYGQLANLCGGELAHNLWDTWLTCRNQIFHYFPDHEKRLTLTEAGQYLEQLATIMDQAISCQLQEK